MTEFESIISATCITNVAVLEDPTKEFVPEDGKRFRLFMAPQAEGGVNNGDVITMKAMLPYSGSEPVDVPIAVGSWSPVLFTALAENDDLTGVDVYVAPINLYKQ